MDTKRLIEDEKPYLDVENLPDGNMRVSLFLPPFNLEDVKAGYKKKLTFFFKKRKFEQMRAKFAKYKSIVVYIDGSVTKNPGPAASAAVFYGRRLKIRNAKDKHGGDWTSSSSSSSEDISDVDEVMQEEEKKFGSGSGGNGIDGNWEQKEDLEYICKSSIFLGHNTSTMAEYTSFIMGLLLCALNNIKVVSVRSHSELMIR